MKYEKNVSELEKIVEQLSTGSSASKKDLLYIKRDWSLQRTVLTSLILSKER